MHVNSELRIKISYGGPPLSHSANACCMPVVYGRHCSGAGDAMGTQTVKNSCPHGADIVVRERQYHNFFGIYVQSQLNFVSLIKMIIIFAVLNLVQNTIKANGTL